MVMGREGEREKRGEERREECREGITYKLSKSQRRRDIRRTGQVPLHNEDERVSRIGGIVISIRCCKEIK